MVIKKFLHSCIALEDKKERLIIDPGIFCFIEGKVKPEDLTPADVILFTHEHADHYDADALAKILAVKKPKILTHKGIHHLLKEKEIKSTVIEPGETKKVGAFTVSAFAAPHGPALGSVPENIGFIINDTFLHPGDSLEFHPTPLLKILALPFMAPWLIVLEAIEVGIKAKPEIVIPIHDGNIKDFSLARSYENAGKKFAESGITFRPLALGETLVIN